MNDLRNKTVVLTGASGGIGKNLAFALATAGALLVLVGRDATCLASITEKLGKKHKYIAADLSTDRGMEAFVTACEELPAIDILINNAGVNEFAFLEQLDTKRVEQIIGVNLLAPMLICKALLPKLQQQKEAVILNMGSTFGSIGYPGNAVYCASKFGLRGFTEALRRELINTAVKVHYLSPRATRTTMNSSAVDAMNKILGIGVDEPKVVVFAVLKLLRAKHGRDAFIGWPEKLFVKINSLFPRLVTQNIAKQLHTIRQFAFHSQQSTGGPL